MENLRLGDSTEEGTQPIRVLNSSIEEDLNQNIERFRDLLILAKEQEKRQPLGEEDPKIVFKCDERKVEDAARILPNNEIILNESFLSFLWCICFSTIVEFNELICKPRLKIESDPELIKQGELLYKYGMSLLSRFTDWKLMTPNPEFHSKELSKNINVASDTYLDAVWFIVLHEYAHVLYGHYDDAREGVGKSSEELREDEIEADGFAIRYCKMVLDGLSGQAKEDRLSGYILGLLALMLSESDLSTPNYPHIHVRVIAVLRSLSWSETNLAWGICACVFKKWAVEYGHSELQVRTHYRSDKEYCMHLGLMLQSTIKPETST